LDRAASKPLASTVIPTPGVEDILGVYRWGLAVRITDVLVTTDNVGGCAETTEHLPFVHPQLPAPQSSGPSQLMVQSILHTDLGDAVLIQLVGWQHWAGTQSTSVVHVWASMGTAVTTTVGGMVVVTGVTGSGVCDVQPARRTAVMQIAISANAFLSIQKNDPL
jgi:hypothetical protein